MYLIIISYLYILCNAVPTQAPTVKPTALPSVALTQSPTTGLPSTAPTIQPTTPPIDCLTGCSVISDFVSILPGTGYGRYILPTFFRLYFNVKAVTLGLNSAERGNVMHLVDLVSGVELLGVYVTEQLSLEYRYGGQVVIPYGPGLLADYVNTMTTVTITISNSRMVVVTNDGTAEVEAVISSQVYTSGRVYQLYVSKYGSSSSSSYGTTSTMSISGKLL